MSLNPYLIRSWLIFPSIKDQFFRKVLTLSGEDRPDIFLFDLEDAIADTSEAKAAARAQLVKYLLHNQSYRDGIMRASLISIRVNGIESPYWCDDVEAVLSIEPHLVVAPKVDSRDHVTAYQQVFNGIPLMVLVETLRGYECRREIIEALRPDDMMAIGYEDLAAELGIERPASLRQPGPLLHIACECLICARQHGTAVMDGPSRYYGTVTNLRRLRRECALAVSMGFQSKVAIHPSQVGVINEVFSKQVIREHSSAMLQRFAALQDGTAVVALDSHEMLDTPSIRLYTERLACLQPLSSSDGQAVGTFATEGADTEVHDS